MTEIFNHEEIFREISTDFMNQSTSDGGAGFNYFNFLASGGGVVPVDTGTDIENFRKMSRVIFKSDFDVGLDTYRTWNLAFNDVLVGDSSDAQGSSGNNQIGPAEVLKNRIPLIVEPQTYGNDTTSFILNSKNFPRFNSTQSCLIFFQGLFKNEDATTNVESVSIVITQNSVDVEIDQAQWNIDTLDGSQDAGNPSAIEIDYSKIQTAIIYIPARDVGDVKFGFLINNEIQFVHEKKLNNSEDYATTPPWGSLNMPIRVSGEKTGANIFTHEYGLFSPTNGLKFVSKMDTTNEPAIVIKKYLHSVFSYCYGGVQNNILFRPFSVGTGEALKNVTTEVPILTLRPDFTFNGNLSKASFSFKRFQFFNKSVNLDNGCIFRIRYNPVLVAFNFIQADPNSAVEFDVESTGLSTNGILMHQRTVFPNNSEVIEFTDDEMINSVFNEFSSVELSGKSTSTDSTPFITMTASPITGVASCDVGGSFDWVEKY